MLASFLLRVITSGEAGGRNGPKVPKDVGRGKWVVRAERYAERRDLRASKLESGGPLVSGQCAVWCYYRWRWRWWWRWRQRAFFTYIHTHTHTFALKLKLTEAARVRMILPQLVGWGNPLLLPRRLPIKVAAANVLFFGLFRLSRLLKYMRVCLCPFTMSVFVWQPLLCCLGVAVANDNDLLWLKDARSARNLIRFEQIPGRSNEPRNSALPSHLNPSLTLTAILRQFWIKKSVLIPMYIKLVYIYFKESYNFNIHLVAKCTYFN